jgi:transposase
MGRRSLHVAEVAEVLTHWAAGRSQRQIARSLGLDRNTVSKYVAPALAAGYAPGADPPPEGWSAFVARVCPSLGPGKPPGAAFTTLAALHPVIEAGLATNRPTTVWQRLHDEAGLTASHSSFRRYVLAHFPTAYGRAGITVRRDDPPPGEEAQVDYGRLGRWTDPTTGQTHVLNAFVLVLTSSRHQFVQVVTHMDAATWLRCHVAAFTFFGGAPRRLILDNLKAGVLHPDRYDPLVHRGYAELAQHYGVLIDPARARKPKDKPRVERQVPYVRESFWRGRTFTSLAEINAAALRWCREVAGRRIHGTTRAEPLLLFEAHEAAALLPLPATPFELAVWSQAKVARDCHVQVRGAVYSIPWRYVGQTLDVRTARGIVRFYADGELAKTHLEGRPGQRQTDWTDYPPEKAAFFQHTPDWCRARAAELGPSVLAAVETLLGEHHLHFLRQSQAILRLADAYGAERLEAACARAVAYGHPHYRTIKAILEKALPPEAAAPTDRAAVVGAYLRGPAAFGVTVPAAEEICA